MAVARYHSRRADRTTIRAVARTGDGKSAIVLGALLMRGGVGFCMVPLLAIGTGQVADARKLCPGIMASCRSTAPPKPTTHPISGLPLATSHSG